MGKKLPPKNLLGFFSYFLSLHKWLVFALCATGMAYGILTTGTTYMLKLMVDVFADPNINSSEVIDTIKYPAIGFIVFIIIEVSNFRLTDYIKLRLIPAIRKDIHSFCFYKSKYSLITSR